MENQLTLNVNESFIHEESLPPLPRSDPTTDPILYQLDHALGFEYMTDVTLIVIEIVNIL